MSRRVKVRERKRAPARGRAARPSPPQPSPRPTPDRFDWTKADANAIAAARAAAGLTRAQLGALAGVSGARIFEVETAFAGRGPNKALRTRIVDSLMAWRGGQVHRTVHAADCPVTVRRNAQGAVCSCSPTQVPVGRPTPPMPTGPKRRDGRAGKKPHLVAAVVLEEPAQGPQPTEEACGLAAVTRAGRPAEGFCPSEDEMAEEERLAAEAGHPVPVDPVAEQALDDNDERDLTA